MSTFTIRVTSSAVNAAGTGFGSSPDQGAPSFWDVVVTNSSDPLVANGVYDGYCLNPLGIIRFSPTLYPSTENYDSTDPAGHAAIGLSTSTRITPEQIARINWVLSQNFSSDAKFNIVDPEGDLAPPGPTKSQYNYGEIQTAIWTILEFTPAEMASGLNTGLLTDNNRQVVRAADVQFLVDASLAAVQSGINVLPADTHFAQILDPGRPAFPDEQPQPIIIQLNKAKLGNFVWSDTDADGIQDAGEAGVNNVVVELYDSNGVFITSTTTGDDFSTAAVEQGYYQFAGLAAGSYKVKFHPPSGTFLTTQNAFANSQDALDSDASPVDGFSQVVTLAAGESNQTIDAGLVSPAKLSGYVYEDDSNDGVRDGGEAGIPGVTVTLMGTDLHGNAVMRSTTTDANGFYEFANLLPGTYKVTEDQPAGYLDGKDTAGSEGGNTGTNDQIDTIVLQSGDNSVENNFGELKPAMLSGYVYHDANNDGSRAGETGIPGATVTLTGTNDLGAAVSVSTTTDANGFYKFDNLRPGTYVVTETQPAGYLDGKDTAGTTPGSLAGNDVISAIVLNSGDNSVENNFGEILPAMLSGYVYEDKDNDGLREGGEGGIPGVTVTLMGTDDFGAAVMLTTTTDANGFYKFDNLRPGTYKVNETQPAGYLDGKDTAGSEGGNTGTNDQIDTIVLQSGDNSVENNFGELKPAALSGFVYCDDDNDGIKDVGEMGLGGVTVRLTGTNDLGVVAAVDVLTNPDGSYSFTGLRPGTYTVTEVTQPADKLDGKDTAGTIDGVTTGTAGNEVINGITLDAGESSINNNFGEILPIGIDIEKFVQGRYVVPGGEGGEGLTPGFWKTHSEFGPAPLSGWPETGYSPTQSYEAIFGVNVTGTPSLLDALGTNGGGESALLRHSSAALLNAANPNVDYAYTVAEVIAMTQAAFANPATIESTKDLFAAQNELGADLSTPAEGSTVVTTAWFDADLPGQGPVIPVGGTALFKYEVRNTGDAELSVVVTDDRITNLTFTGGDTDGDGKLDTNEVWTYTAQETVVAGPEYVNEGKAVGTDAGGRVTHDTDLAHYTIPELTASIGDRVFEDRNANGVQDAGELGIAMVTVLLKDTLGNVLQSKVTDANGNYLFDVTPGNYVVGIVKPSGYEVSPKDAGGNDNTDSDVSASTLMSDAVVITAGEQNLSVDAGLYRKASVGDKVFLDCDMDGSQDAGEPGVAGVTVKLLNANGMVAGTTTTNANGEYSFTNLVPGTYSVEFVKPTGYSFTTQDKAGVSDALDSDANVSTGRTASFTLVSGENRTDIDAGLTAPKQCLTFDFSGSTGTDGYDGNVRTYTNPGVAVNVSAFARDRATGAWSNAYLGAYGGGLGATDSSEGDGSGNRHTVDNVGGRDNYVLFEFNQVVTLDSAYLGYVVNDSDLKVWIGTKTDAFNNHGTLSDAYLASMGFTEVNTTTLTGARLAELNAGGFQGNVIIIAADTTDMSPEDYFKIDQLNVCTNPCVDPTIKGSIGDRVFHDLNANGIQETGEAGIAGATVKLLNAAGSVIATTTTDSQGLYKFNGLDAGDYKVQFFKPTGFFSSTRANVGADNLDSDIAKTTASSATTATINLSAGENDMTVDAGFYKQACIGDRVWEDKNHNGIQDVGEPGIGGIRVALINSAGAEVAWTTTNSSGNYSFMVDPGTYKLKFDKANVQHYSYGNWYNMSYWYWGMKNVGTNDNIDSDVNRTTTTDAAAQVTYTDWTTLTSGEDDKSWDATITPIVIDLNGDGVQTVSRADSAGKFDLFGNGTAIDSGWVSSSDGMLAVDRNGNGVIDDINELFGGTTKGDGFAELASYDSNGDGKVDAADANFADLLVWQDADGDHVTDVGELTTLEEAGIASLDTGFVELPFVDANGNLHLERSTATRVDGSSAYVTDVYFNVAREDADAAGIDLSSVADLLGDDGIDLSGASSIGAEDAGSTLDLAGLLASGALDVAAEAASQAADDAADLAAIELLGHQQACETC